MIELRRPHWILALTLAVMVHLAAYVLTYSLPGVPRTFRGGGLHDQGDDFSDIGNSVLVALGGASESADEAGIDGPPLEPSQPLAQGFVEADGDMGADAKLAEPVAALNPAAEALAEETVDLQAQEAGTAEVIVADPSETEPAAKAPPIPERKPEPPVIQPELEAFAQRFSVQGPTAPLPAPVQSEAPPQAPVEIASAPPPQAPVETVSAPPLQAPVQSVAPAQAPVETARVAPPRAPVQTASAPPARAPAQRGAPAQTASAAAVQGNATAAAQPSATVMSFASRSSGVGTASGNEFGEISHLNYADRVLLWLKRHGTYPREGLRFKMEGVVLLRFAIRRDGTILYYDLIKESSWDTLNGAVRRMMDRSSPVPRIPRDIAKDEIVFTIPVRFTVHEGAPSRARRSNYRARRGGRSR